MDSQNKNTRLHFLIVILCVSVVALGGYIVYDKTQNNKTTVIDTTNNTSNTVTNNTSNSNTNTLVSKLDNTKDWVYDANYPKNVKVSSYTNEFGNTYYAKDIIVPYININSAYANSSNIEIKSIFDDAVRRYNEGINDKWNCVNECNYKKFINNDILSLGLTYDTCAPVVVSTEYYTYNIDLKTGNQLSYEEIYTIAGFNSSNINSKVENAVTNVMKKRMSSFTADNYFDGTNFDTYNNESISNYKNSIKNNTLKYFLSNEGKLNVIVTLSIPVEGGRFDTVIPVE